MSCNIAIVGSTGAVGREMLETLSYRKFPCKNVYALAAKSSLGKEVSFGEDKVLKVEALQDFDFSKADIALFSAGSDVSKKFAPIAGKNKCIVIDNSSFFRMDKDVPLIVPEVNPNHITDFKKKNIIANPNCSTIQMMLALKPIHDEAEIQRVNVATYQAVSGAGAGGVRELAAQTANLLNTKPIESKVMPVQIAFNAIPHINTFEENGYTLEEMKMVWETKKILEDDSIQVNPTCVRIPVFYGHSEAVNIETKQPITKTRAEELLDAAPGVELFRDNGYPTAVTDAAGQDPVYVGRVREDISCENGLNMWVVSDNVRKGAALNSIQIAEVLKDSLSNA